MYISCRRNGTLTTWIPEVLLALIAVITYRELSTLRSTNSSVRYQPSSSRALKQLGKLGLPCDWLPLYVNLTILLNSRSLEQTPHAYSMATNPYSSTNGSEFLKSGTSYVERSITTAVRLDSF